MPITGPFIKVDTTTTRGELESFLKDNAKAGDRVLGKTDKAGATIIYLSSSKAGLMDRMTGKAADRRADARAAVDTVMNNYDGKLTAKGLTAGGTAVKTFLFTKLRERREAHNTSALRGGEVRRLLSDAKVVGRDLPRATGQATPAAPPQRPGPTLIDTGLGPQEFQTLATAIEGIDPPLGTDGNLSPALAQAADNLADSIAQTYSQAHPTRAGLETFAFSDGSALRHQMGKVLATVLPPGTLTDGAIASFSTRVFDGAACRLSPDKVVAGGDRTIPAAGTGNATVTLPSVTVGNKTYEPVKFLGVGGYAKVYEYRCPADGERIAFKVPLEHEMRSDLDEGTNAAAEEVAAHRTAQGNGHGNIVGLKGAVRLPDGRIGMALELASSGDVHEMTSKISDAIGNGPGKISQAQADLLRLTLVKDMAQGLSHLRANNMIHFDFKTPNVMIGADGSAKIADFGTTRAGASISAVGAPVVDNPIFQAPEMIYLKRHIESTDDQITAAIGTRSGHLKEEMKSIFIGSEVGQIKTICETILRPEKDNLKAQIEANNAGLSLSNQADTWALGMAAANVFGVPFVFEQMSFMGDMEDALTAFRQNPANVALGARQADGSLPPGALGETTRIPAVTTLINDLLRPDPTARPALNTVLGSAVLSNPAVGGQQAHALIAALASGDPAAIDNARDRLAARMQG